MASLIKKATYHRLLPLRLPPLACLQLRLLPPLQLRLPHRPYLPRPHLQAIRNLLHSAHRVRPKHQLLRHRRHHRKLRRRTPPLYLLHQMYLLLRRQHLQLPPHPRHPRHLLRRLRPHLQLVRTHLCPAHRVRPKHQLLRHHRQRLHPRYPPHQVFLVLPRLQAHRRHH